MKEVDDVTTDAPGMASHPDIMALRARYEQAGATPTAQVVDGLTFLAGLYMAISPWVVGFDHFTTLTVNNLIIGAALAMLAVGFASAYGRTHGLAWVVPIIGIWMIITPWVISGSVATTGTIVSNVIVGAVAALLGLGALGVGLLGKR